MRILSSAAGLGLNPMNGRSQSRPIAGGERLNVCIRMCLPPEHVKETSFQDPP